ncbi:PREDICTED: 22.7 kDa class IV heat shock protein-like [Nelumbo nucifera]|uniref:SHSP domain-containing protein n=2 Tax=Nelumbo nucifera TaxID=4432 RepID=A0A822YYF3_NELNU|nr:PREDICTED: 22.7 kDa class IV heat shock protein-like [Nelumbo nucifera]DAD37692.1 TPA_asm: hypothetical protein HUJ06_008333 [Nelumbo nucifera]
MKVVLWMCMAVVGVALLVPAASLFPGGGNPWEAFMYPYKPQYGNGDMGNIYMNQATETEILVQCKETSNAYIYTLQIPGMKKEDVKVEVEKHILRIKGEEKKYDKEKGEVHWSYGQFWKQIPLAEDAKGDDIHTDVSNGVLTITVPRHSHRRMP